MFEYIDVTNDPSVERKAGISEGAVARALALGFVDVGWVAAIVRAGSSSEEKEAAAASKPTAAPKGPVTQVLISRVMASSADAGLVMLALTRTKGRDTISLKTLFEDGHVVSTEERPHGFAGALVSRAITVSPRHHYDLATFPTPDLGMLVDLHLRRVASARSGKALDSSGKEKADPDFVATVAGASTERTPVHGNLYVYIAMRKRYREIANPRFEAQQIFATRVSWGVFFAIAGASFAFLAALGVRGSSAVGAGLVAFLFAAVCGAGSFPLALIMLAPIFVKDAKADAPKARTGAEVLELANDTREGRVPMIDDPQEAEAAEDDDGARGGGAGAGADEEERQLARRAAARRLGSMEPLSPEALARLRRLDTIISILSSLLLPAVGFVLMPTLGSAGPTAALGSVASLDAAILFIMKRSRVDLLRERFIPDLSRAEGPDASLAPPWLKWISLAIGVLALVAARRSISKGIEQAPQWLLVEWGFLTILFIFAAWRSIKRRHARFDASH